MNERRRHPRLPLSIEVKITHDSLESVVLLTRDISEGGIFVVTDGQPLPPVGTKIAGQVQSPMAEMPVVQMEVVRVEPDGVGLRFIEED
jgi:hypothetical protein